jgi:hypothetical protein
MPHGIHVTNVPIDAAIGWTQEDGTRAHQYLDDNDHLTIMIDEHEIRNRQ